MSIGRVLAAVGILSGLAGCGEGGHSTTGTDSTATPTAKTTKGTIGLSVLTLDNPFFKVDRGYGDRRSSEERVFGFSGQWR